MNLFKGNLLMNLFSVIRTIGILVKNKIQEMKNYYANCSYIHIQQISSKQYLPNVYTAKMKRKINIDNTNNSYYIQNNSYYKVLQFGKIINILDLVNENNIIHEHINVLDDPISITTLYFKISHMALHNTVDMQHLNIVDGVLKEHKLFNIVNKMPDNIYPVHLHENNVLLKTKFDAIRTINEDTYPNKMVSRVASIILTDNENENFELTFKYNLLSIANIYDCSIRTIMYIPSDPYKLYYGKDRTKYLNVSANIIKYGYSILAFRK